jgi:hypothetical protein
MCSLLAADRASAIHGMSLQGYAARGYIRVTFTAAPSLSRPAKMQVTNPLPAGGPARLVMVV